MNKYLMGPLFLLFLGAHAHAADDQVSIAGFVSKLAEENAINVEGLSVVGKDTFKPPSRVVSVDKGLSRALTRYNYIVNYGNDRIVRLLIMSRKGSSVGPLPDEIVIEPPPPDPAPRQDEDN